jgi:hypothetical protein
LSRAKTLVIPQKSARPREAGWLDAGTTDPKLALRRTAGDGVILSIAKDLRPHWKRLYKSKFQDGVLLSASFGSAADFWVITSENSLLKCYTPLFRAMITSSIQEKKKRSAAQERGK